MKNKELHSVISSSPLALAYPQMAAACISADVTADMFDRIHTCMMGEPAPAMTSAQESNAEDIAAIDNLLLSVLAH